MDYQRFYRVKLTGCLFLQPGSQNVATGLHTLTARNRQPETGSQNVATVLAARNWQPEHARPWPPETNWRPEHGHWPPDSARQKLAQKLAARMWPQATSQSPTPDWPQTRAASGRQIWSPVTQTVRHWQPECGNTVAASARNWDHWPLWPPTRAAEACQAWQLGQPTKNTHTTNTKLSQNVAQKRLQFDRLETTVKCVAN